MIGCVVNVIKEREIDALVTPWVNAWVAYLLAVWQATATVEDDKVAAGVLDLTEYVSTKDTEMTDAFSSHIIHARTRTACTGAKLNAMTQALHAEDGSLPHSLKIQNAYTERHNGSKNVAIEVRNGMAYPQTLSKKIPVARAVVATWVPEPPMWAGMIETLDNAQGLWTPKLTAKQRQEKLFEKLDPSGLESWPLELADSTQSLLAEYHNIFSLEPSELGCTHSNEHMIKVINDAPLKEQFKQIPPPLVNEVHTNLQEMLDSGAICLSQSVRCNAVVLVWKKDGGLCFSLDFCHLNTHT